MSSSAHQLRTHHARGIVAGHLLVSSRAETRPEEDMSRPRRLLSAVALAALAVGVLPAGSAFAAEPRDPTDFACPTGEVPDAGFTDTEGIFHEASIDCLVWYGFSRGTSDTRFSPERDVTRGQMARFIANLVAGGGVVLPSDPPNAFTDDDGTAHELPINQLAELGVVGGTGGSRFQPNRAVNRAQMATFLNNAFAEVTGSRLSSSENFFSDDDGNFHEGNINAVADAGIAAGTSATRYSPGLAVKRAQMASFLVRETDLLVELGFVAVPRAGNPTALNVPELLRVEPVSVTQVRFVFDEAVTDSVAISSFALYGVSADRTAASDATLDGDRAVIATFTEDAVANATVAGVAAGAVQDADGNLSPEGSVGVQAVDLAPGTTVAPDLVEVAPREGEADFVFDEPAVAVSNTGYHLVLADGSRVTATDEEPAGNGSATHTVTFADLTAQQASQVAFGYVDAGTVSDAEQDGNPVNGTEGNANVLQLADVSETGLTQRPDLVSVEVSADDTAVYTFDENVVRSQDQFGQAQGGFRLYNVDGSVLTPSSVGRTGTKEFTATFADGSVTELVSGAIVQENTVAASGDSETNRPQELGFEVSFVAGDTAAPDLLTAEVVEDAETTDRTVTFTFDTSVAELADATGLHVHQPDGSSMAFSAPGSFPPTDSGCRVDSEDDTRVVCTVTREEQEELWLFLADAVIATTEREVVSAAQGHANPEGAALLNGSVSNPEPEGGQA
jgi:hypothetical protein